MGTLEGKTALVTGGESGIGLAIVRLFVAEGAKVHLLGLDRTRLSAAIEEIGEERVIATVADVSNEDAVRDSIATGVARLGGYDVVVSNAGITGAVASIADYPSEEFARTLAVHILGGFHILKHAGVHVRAGGSIILMSSLVGLIGFEGVSGYVAAKHGQVGLMRSAAKEFAARRIRVNTLHPGPTSTAFQDSIETRVTGQSREEAAKAFDALIPLGRHMTPEEIAQAALYLAADASAMVTGSTFRIDGGLGG
ncbi:SDR family NAD(P)-dependent oxidoreductase [Paraburkholderia phytofirmans]|uniref:SDR family NAD(P)-dependent oxidoreductase n=1 Tax=Paraburkholderia sp. BL6665CI2N2 TaxID=1938806 RepID=UPI001065F051|nr:SDR family NAD(P)-dependent oxidoreductase [Paraburkholderia sp. BL6665CI2N2]TDY22037.1 NAD(P)-dependent dehydrogenase (short-subunit alcohol dehydrogenase family) [Paraburkholderia sp. BL6665CI2N2]